MHEENMYIFDDENNSTLGDCLAADYDIEDDVIGGSDDKVESCLNVLCIENKDLIEIYVALSKDYPFEYQFSISREDFELNENGYIDSAIEFYLLEKDEKPW